MGKRREIAQAIKSYGEIKNILEAMKNLALMETNKLQRSLATQQRVTTSMEAVAADFLQFYPEAKISGGKEQPIYILLGSERGFCGDFNETIKTAWETHSADEHRSPATTLTLGYRLATKFAKDPRIAITLDGASVMEEIDAVLTRLMEQLQQLIVNYSDDAIPQFIILAHHPANSGITLTKLPGQFEQRPVPFRHQPYLSMAPAQFYNEFIQYYLLSKLHEIFYNSLMAENLKRLQHMETAIQRIEQESTQRQLALNRLRQEEITEEIEVLLLSVDALRK